MQYGNPSWSYWLRTLGLKMPLLMENLLIQVIPRLLPYSIKREII